MKDKKFQFFFHLHKIDCINVRWNYWSIYSICNIYFCILYQTNFSNEWKKIKLQFQKLKYVNKLNNVEINIFLTVIKLSYILNCIISFSYNIYICIKYCLFYFLWKKIKLQGLSAKHLKIYKIITNSFYLNINNLSISF